jgi:hypothetical protein
LQIANFHLRPDIRHVYSPCQQENDAVAYTTEKLSKSRVAIYRDGAYLCQLRPAEVAGWIFRAERSNANDVEWEELRRVYRVEAATAYLAKRATRAAAVQLTLF